VATRFVLNRVAGLGVPDLLLWRCIMNIGLNMELNPAIKFRLGKIVTTVNARQFLAQEDIATGIARHQSGEWGHICEGDRKVNCQALLKGRKVLSAYHAKNGIRFWIITEADRSETRVLLPYEY